MLHCPTVAGVCFICRLAGLFFTDFLFAPTAIAPDETGTTSYPIF